jgi:hypothetical protein
MDDNQDLQLFNFKCKNTVLECVGMKYCVCVCLNAHNMVITGEGTAY